MVIPARHARRARGSLRWTCPRFSLLLPPLAFPLPRFPPSRPANVAARRAQVFALDMSRDESRQGVPGSIPLDRDFVAMTVEAWVWPFATDGAHHDAYASQFGSIISIEETADLGVLGDQLFFGTRLPSRLRLVLASGICSPPGCDWCIRFYMYKLVILVIRIQTARSCPRQALPESSAPQSSHSARALTPSAP
eukprot:1193944-Prorocentrum_minimum.AAC.1